MTSGEPEIRIRTVTVAEIPDVASVQLRSALSAFAGIFPASLPKPTQEELEGEWGDLIAEANRSVLAASVDGEFVAAVAFGPDDDVDKGTDCILLKLYVVPDWFGRGIGSLLYDRVIDTFHKEGYRKARLWVLVDNTWARRMYERRGWVVQPWIRSDWPGSGVDEIGYVLELS
ncbi:MAG: GNAT family N-acetyltransferase [bacterium]|nr:GNAT family N-acetyltransferase [bacterium]MCP4964635.1 GNAT family N-acetyltransferase [bacterium]